MRGKGTLECVPFFAPVASTAVLNWRIILVVINFWAPMVGLAAASHAAC
jgi:hypothetical protein